MEYQFLDNVVLDLGYKYFAVPKVSFDDGIKADHDAHSVELGLRFYF